MRNFFIVIIVLVVCVSSGQVFGQETSQPVPAPVPATSEEVSALRTEIAELKAAIAGLQKAQPEKTVSIGVLPIDRAGMIPQVRDSFRQVLVSALREAGILALESLDDETLRWVQRQDQLVRERWIDPVTAPKRGELQGVSHYLLGTVTRYEENDIEKDTVLFGIIKVTVGGHGTRIRTGSLVVDFRLVEAESGKVIDAFRTESLVQQKERGGVIYISFAGAGWYRSEAPLPEIAARACAQEAANRIAGVINPAPPKPAAAAEPAK